MDIKTKHKLKKIINELDAIRGRHTELVSVYLPTGYDINKAISHLSEEQGTASNIKDSRTRNNVQGSLERAVRTLRLYKRIPPNGIVIFVGNASTDESKIDIKVWTVEPPEPLMQRIYRCDQTFKTDILKEFLEYKEIFGLVVMDRREATIGILKGPRIELLTDATSGVPGKFKAGGQCCAPDTLVVLDDGNIVEINKTHNPNIILSANLNQEKSETTPIVAKWENKKELFEVITKYPRMKIKASQDHTFFVRTEKGLEEKPLSEISEGNYLIMPEKINVNTEDQPISFKPFIKRVSQTKAVKLPNKINPEFARILGYYLGDGDHEIDRINFSEQREDVAKYYKKLIEKAFNIKANIKFRKDKNYYQIRAHSRIISQLFRFFFKEEKTLSGRIPELILKSSDRSLAAFIAGFFDAEGYVQKTRVALGINNELLTRQLQLCLLRLGIITSINEYDNRRNPYSDKTRYTLSVEDKESLKKFNDLIKLSSKEKQKKLEKAVKLRSNRNKVRQLIVNGREVARIIKNSGLSIRQFRCSSFFTNKRQMSKEVFKTQILNKIKDRDLRKRLNLFYDSNLIAVKIAKIKKAGLNNTVDIETKSHNFIANGLVVHNSAQRFHRLIEGMALQFYKKIALLCNQEFLPLIKEMKGIIIGGPGHSKNEFIEELNQQLKDKIIAVQDITYTDESGLHHLVEKSKDILAKEAITEEKELMNRFLTLLAKEPGKAVYGEDNVKEAITMGAVELVLLSEKLSDEKIDEFEELAAKYGAEVKLISIETREGVQLKDLKGIAAILRYQIK